MMLLGPIFAANNMTELKLGKGSWSGHILSAIAKYWLRLLRMDSLEAVRTCYGCS
jgi:hypothetical protein